MGHRGGMGYSKNKKTQSSAQSASGGSRIRNGAGGKPFSISSLPGERAASRRRKSGQGSRERETGQPSAIMIDEQGKRKSGRGNHDIGER